MDPDFAVPQSFPLSIYFEYEGMQRLYTVVGWNAMIWPVRKVVVIYAGDSV